MGACRVMLNIIEFSVANVTDGWNSCCFSEHEEWCFSSVMNVFVLIGKTKRLGGLD